MNKTTLDNIETRMEAIFWHPIPMEKVSQAIDMVTTMYRLHRLREYTKGLRDGVKVGDVVVGLELQERLNTYARLYAVISGSAFECTDGVDNRERLPWSIKNGSKKYYDGRLRGHRRNVRRVIASLLYKGNVGDPNDQTTLSENHAKGCPNFSALLGMAGKPKFEYWLKPILLDRILRLQDQIKSDLIRAGAYIKKEEV